MLPNPPKIAAAKPTTTTSLKHVPFLTKQKRKRGESGILESPGSGTRPPKRKAQSPVHISTPPVKIALSPAPGNRQRRLENTIDDHQLNVPKQATRTYSQTDSDRVAHKAEVMDDSSSTSYDVLDLSPLQQTIESQFSLEILLKHRELRLIDQELAKCQVALEQLRRCEVMPYPAVSSDPNVMAMVSSGTGPACDTRGRSLAPWGVTDGPYARHYAKWLMPDSAFGDSTREDWHAHLGGSVLHDRATRGSKSSSARAQRGSAREKLQALPHGYPEPKEDKGIVIVKRSTDNQMVKLVCLDCQREDFNSAQGFINHCRIAHGRGFPSHEQAILACGKELERDANGVVIGSTTGPAYTNTAVHPLIRSAQLPDAGIKLPPSTQRKRKRTQTSTTAAPHSSGNLDTIDNMPATPQPGPAAQVNVQAPFMFKPSPRTPHLSALFAKNGRGGDLEEMVTEATRRPEPEPDLLMTDDLEDEGEDIEESIEQSVPQQNLLRGGGGRLPARSAMSPAPLERTPSSRGVQARTQQRPDHLNTFMPNTSYTPSNDRPTSTSPRQAYDIHQHNQGVVGPPVTSPTLNLSPTTIESHPAPSLVSDDGDYENTHSESEAPSSAVVSDDEDTFEVQLQDSDHHAMDIDNPSSSTTVDYGMAKPHHRVSRPAGRRPSARRNSSLRGTGLAQRRVSFQSRSRTMDGKNKKRRK